MILMKKRVILTFSRFSVEYEYFYQKMRLCQQTFTDIIEEDRIQRKEAVRR